MLAGKRHQRGVGALQYQAHIVDHFRLPFKATGRLNIPGVFLNMSNAYRSQAKIALWNRFKSISPHPFDSKGYLKNIAHNLLPNVKLYQFEDDLIQGSGNEFDWKFLAVHSSSALVVNTFAPFKDTPSDLKLLDVKGFKSITFE